MLIHLFCRNRLYRSRLENAPASQIFANERGVVPVYALHSPRLENTFQSVIDIATAAAQHFGHAASRAAASFDIRDPFGPAHTRPQHTGLLTAARYVQPPSVRPSVRQLVFLCNVNNSRSIYAARNESNAVEPRCARNDATLRQA